MGQRKFSLLGILGGLLLVVSLALLVPAAQSRLYEGDFYSIKIPRDWQVTERRPAATTLSVPGRLAIDIYHEDLYTKKDSPAETYVLYGNRYLTDSKHLTMLAQTRKAKGPAEIDYDYTWRRQALDAQDLNYYREVDLIRGKHVYTFILRTTEANFAADSKALDKILRSFKVTTKPKVWPQRNVAYQADANAVISRKYVGEQKLQIKLPTEGLVWGIFDGKAPYDLAPLQKREAEIGKHFDLVMTYRDFSKPFPLAAVQAAAKDNRLTMLTWQPWINGNRTDIVLIPDIAAGKYDDYIRTWAKGVKAFGQPILLRFANEMNGDWDPWCVWFYGKDHTVYIKAWQRVHRIFTAEGATNAMWVWNPHDRSYPNYKWNDPHLYYPGDEYVDWIGLTGYNNGTSYPGDRWRSFNEIYRDIYAEYTALYPDKPLLITEFASNEVGGDKAAWITDTFYQLKTNYPRIKLAVWFDKVDMRWQYPFASTPAAKKAFIEGIQDPYYKTGMVKWVGEEPRSAE